MKKLIAGVLIASSLIYAPQVDAKSKSLCSIPGKMYDAISIHNDKDLKAINGGKYTFKGVKIGNTMKYVKSKLGKPESFIITKDKTGTTGYLMYGDYTLTFYSPKRFVSDDTLKLSAISILLEEEKRILKRDIESVVGPAKQSNVEIEGEKIDIFNYLGVQYSPISKGKIAIMAHMMKPSLYQSDSVVSKDNLVGNKLKNLKPKKLTVAELKALNNGKFNYKGLKFGASPATIKKAAGNSNSDEYTNEEDTHTLTQSYGYKDWIELDYTADKCDGKYISDYLTFDYSKLKVTEKEMRAALGKPSDSYTDSYEDDEKPGKMIYMKTLEYKHLDVNLEKVGKTYYVDYIDVFR